MAEDDELHARLEELERKLAEERRGLRAMSKERRQGISALIESISEAMDRHEKLPPQ